MEGRQACLLSRCLSEACTPEGCRRVETTVEGRQACLLSRCLSEACTPEGCRRVETTVEGRQACLLSRCLSEVCTPEGYRRVETTVEGRQAANTSGSLLTSSLQVQVNEVLIHAFFLQLFVCAQSLDVMVPAASRPNGSAMDRKIALMQRMRKTVV